MAADETFDVGILKKDWKNKVTRGVDFLDDDLQHISTGSIKLDWALRRPFIEGSMVEIFGANASGKTTLALEVCSNAMKMGKLVFYIDLEYKLREAQLNMIEGLEKDKLTIVYPDTGEEAMNMMHELMISYPGCVIVLDSVGGILPEVENAENFEKQSMASVARLCHKMIRKLTGVNSRNKCVTIFLNHLTATMIAYGKPTTTHGGNAIRNRASQRIELFTPSAGKIKVGEDVLGQRVRATVIKNNVNRPYIVVTFPIMYGKGIDTALDILEFARDTGVVSQKGGWWTLEIDEEDKKFREVQLLEMLRTDEAFAEDIKARINAVYQ